MADIHQGLVLLEGNAIGGRWGLMQIATDDALQALPAWCSVRHTGEEALEILIQHVPLVRIRCHHQQRHAALDKQTCQKVGLCTAGNATHRIPWPGHGGRARLEVSKELRHLFDSTSDLEDR